MVLKQHVIATKMLEINVLKLKIANSMVQTVMLINTAYLTMDDSTLTPRRVAFHIVKEYGHDLLCPLLGILKEELVMSFEATFPLPTLSDPSTQPIEEFTIDPDTQNTSGHCTYSLFATQREVFLNPFKQY